MGRTGLTREQVFDAADALSSRGKRVTVSALRKSLGDTGSFSTISIHLKAWREERGEQSAEIPDEIETSILGFLRRFWRVLLRALGAQTDRRLAGMQAELQHGFETHVARLEGLHEESIARLEQLRKELHHAEDLLGTMEHELEVLRKRERDRDREESRSSAPVHTRVQPR